MNRRGNWLGYAAIALGAFALVVALGANGHRGPRLYDRVVHTQAVEAEQSARRGVPFSAGEAPWSRRHGQPAPPVPPVAPAAPAVEFHHAEGWLGGPGFFMGPFGWFGMILGNLRDALLAFLLIAIGWRLLRGRQDPGAAPGTTEAPLA